MKLRSLGTLSLAAFSLSSFGQTTPSKVEPHDVDIVFMVDVSGSTNRHRAIEKQFMHDLVKTKVDTGTVNRLRIGFVTYGDNSNKPQMWQLTDNMLKAEATLAAIQDRDGGIEMIGDVLSGSTTSFAWNDSKDMERHVVVIGNESIYQGPTLVDDAISLAHDKGITVDAVWCGGVTPLTDREEWQKLAKLGKGDYFELEPGAAKYTPPIVYRSNSPIRGRG